MHYNPEIKLDANLIPPNLRLIELVQLFYPEYEALSFDKGISLVNYKKGIKEKLYALSDSVSNIQDLTCLSIDNKKLLLFVIEYECGEVSIKYAFDKKRCSIEDLGSLLNKIQEIIEPTPQLYVVTPSSYSINLHPVFDLNLTSTIYSELYPQFSDIDLLISNYLSARERLLILTGQPGTGKTSLIKKLIQDSNLTSKFYCKDLALLKGSNSFWEEISDRIPDLLILDDMDIPLRSRDREGDDASSVFISNLLSYTDGILSSTNNTKIVITTNQEISEIDSALVRPGRLFDFIHLSPLNKDQAYTFWTNVLNNTEESFDSIYSIDNEYFQSAIMQADFELHNNITRNYYSDGPKNPYISLKENKIVSAKETAMGF